MSQAGAAAAAVLLLAAWWWRRQADQAGELVASETGNAPGDPLAWPADLELPAAGREPFDPLAGFEAVTAPLLSIVNQVRGTSAAGLTTSAAGLAHMQQFEGLRLERYRLGDGGWTIGWGRFYPDGGEVPPERIDRATADAWFRQDVAERGERWVRAYVTAELTQPQFDALVSMAYNLSPRSFRRIADQVNAGGDPEPIALQYIRAGTNLERGLRNRRAAELAMFRADPVTYG